MPSRKENEEFGFCSAEWVHVRLPAYHREIESLFDEIIHRAWGRATWQPGVQLVETADAYIVEADLPGVEPDNVQLVVEDHRLAITGERKHSGSERSGRVLVAEHPVGPFVRVIEFRARINRDKVQKQFANGVLRVVVPKLQPEGEP